MTAKYAPYTEHPINTQLLSIQLNNNLRRHLRSASCLLVKSLLVAFVGSRTTVALSPLNVCSHIARTPAWDKRESAPSPRSTSCLAFQQTPLIDHAKVYVPPLYSRKTVPNFSMVELCGGIAQAKVGVSWGGGGKGVEQSSITRVHLGRRIGYRPEDKQTKNRSVSVAYV